MYKKINLNTYTMEQEIKNKIISQLYNKQELKLTLQNYLTKESVKEQDNIELKNWKKNICEIFIQTTLINNPIPKKNFWICLFLKLKRKFYPKEIQTFIAEKIIDDCDNFSKYIRDVPVPHTPEKEPHTPEKEPSTFNNNILELIQQLLGYYNLYQQDNVLYLNILNSQFNEMEEEINKMGFTFQHYTDDLNEQEKNEHFDFLYKKNINSAIPQYPAVLKIQNQKLVYRGWVYLPEK